LWFEVQPFCFNLFATASCLSYIALNSYIFIVFRGNLDLQVEYRTNNQWLFAGPAWPESRGYGSALRGGYFKAQA
jgi:hypothetical protein